MPKRTENRRKFVNIDEMGILKEQVQLLSIVAFYPEIYSSRAQSLWCWVQC